MGRHQCRLGNTRQWWIQPVPPPPPPALFLDQPEARRAEQMYFGDQAHFH